MIVAPQTTQEFAGALALCRGMSNIAQQTFSAMKYALQNNMLLQLVFVVSFYIVILNLLYEASKILLHSTHKSLWALASPEFVRRFVRALILLTMGIGAYAAIILQVGVGHPDPTKVELLTPVPWVHSKVVMWSAKPFTGFTPEIGDVQSEYKIIQDAWDSSSSDTYDELTEEAAAAMKAANHDVKLSPEFWLACIDKAITNTSSKLDAWTFVENMQKAAISKLAEKAAADTWAEIEAHGVPPSVVEATSSENPKDQIETKFGQFFMIIGDFLHLGTNALVGICITIAYFCMDLIIIKVLWMNALYMAMSYQIALILLPSALVLAYFPSTSGILVQIVKLVFVGAISLQFFATATTYVLNPDTIRDATIQHFEVTSQNISDSMKAFSQGIYLELMRENGAPPSQTEYMKRIRLRADTEGYSNFGVVDTKGATAILPLIALIGMTFMVSVVGKISTVIQDALNGTMSYHRG